ncbi:CaiB/BaiF CoA transferase family protein [Salinisphaera aquimarina]|uniref:CaiB/BaiF CoA transferase family protein n=1 Tax=Salinisphaera aquimarina TaxID=2094031 RepID=A0ABV7ETW6_9GAMM
MDSMLLDGVRVLEFGQIAAGPFAGSLLADLGADVVKIERPGAGDGMRSWPPLTANDNQETYSENFASLNRNKRSVTLDLKSDVDRPALLDLCRSADVIIENFRPGVMRRLGLDHEQLSEDNPGLIFCSISGYGQTGPYADRGAFDVTIQAMSGLMSVTGEDGGNPVKCGVPVGDFCAGLYAGYAVVSALYKRAKTGRGRAIDCSMLGSLIGVAALQTSEYFGTGNGGRRLGSAHPRNAPYQAFRALDDHFVIAAGNDKLWRSVCDVVGAPELAERPEFASQLLRAQNQYELTEILEGFFAHNSAEYWLDAMQARGIPASRINDYADVIADPHVEQMGIVQPLSLPNGVQTRTTGFPVLMSDYAFSVRRHPPHLGEHTSEVLNEWVGTNTAYRAN